MSATPTSVTMATNVATIHPSDVHQNQSDDFRPPVPMKPAIRPNSISVTPTTHVTSTTSPGGEYQKHIAELTKKLSAQTITSPARSVWN